MAFSRLDLLMLRDQIASSGHPVSVIYGALPPEVRRREAERFASGESHILVATDAIGMGLNLPIRRVLFSTLTQFDGAADRKLDISEVHQIAGRAGRYGMHDEGFAGVLAEAEPAALRSLKDLLPRQPSAPQDFKAPVDTRSQGQVDEFLTWSHNHAVAGHGGKPWFLDAVDGHSRLDHMVQALRACTMWLWLDLRFPGVYGYLDEVLMLRGALNDGVEPQLKGKRPLAQQRRGKR